MSWIAPAADETFEQAMASKPDARFSDFNWYVALLAHASLSIEGLDAKDYPFHLNTDDPVVWQFFRQRVAPHVAAIEMFSTRH